MKVQQRPHALAIPIQAVGSEKGSTVYVIGENHEIESRAVKLGLETPDYYEVISGLKEREQVMIGNRSQVHPGQQVETKLINNTAAE